MEEMRTPTFRGYCLATCIDERQATAASMMEKFAEQLRMTDFKRAIQRYKATRTRRADLHATERGQSDQPTPHFWYGLLLCEQGQDEGLGTIKQTLNLGMFPVLLLSLRWLQSSQPRLYEEQIVPMLRI